MAAASPSFNYFQASSPWLASRARMCADDTFRRVLKCMKRSHRIRDDGDFSMDKVRVWGSGVGIREMSFPGEKEITFVPSSNSKATAFGSDHQPCVRNLQ